MAEWPKGWHRPTAILVVSAHWEAAPLTLGALDTAPLTYDFWGFPERCHQVTYPAPGAPELAEKAGKLLCSSDTPISHEPARGLDHGAYVPLVEMFSEADVPVLQVSMPSSDPGESVKSGRRLAPLRDKGVLIIGSGFFTHDLRGLDTGRGSGHTPPGWSSEFDDRGTALRRRGIRTR